MTAFTTPTDWKSAVWWRNRPRQERVFHLHLPDRIRDNMTDWEPYQSFVEDWSPSKNLFVQGSSGSGKSLRAAQTLTELVKRGEVSGRWVDSDGYIEMLKDSFDNEGLLPEMYSSPHTIKYVKGVFDVIVIDGLGEERLTEFASHELGSLIRRRFDHNLSTIITSRLSMQDIKNRYGSRLAVPLAEFQLESARGKR